MQTLYHIEFGTAINIVTDEVGLVLDMNGQQFVLPKEIIQPMINQIQELEPKITFSGEVVNNGAMQ